ncbi:MAG: nucleoside monophosphate kinase [Acidobacteria bacterium]|nr:nucleoside monophosphate kinase [Acidobacteriota bacterium]MCU0253314.1 nucleoside monophosphate kinase [Acidobacteriota bacterium]
MPLVTAPARPALLLLGPTGSGKSPLGRALERRAGWPHLDFGAELRRIAAGDGGRGLDPGERDFVRGLIAAHALFPDDALPLVRRIVAGALAGFGPGGPVVLNGVPRTLAQARGIADLVAVRTVATLVVRPEVVRERVARRAAGRGPDDSGRDDDTPAAVEQKLELFERATRPLVAHYRAAGATIVEVPVRANSDPERQARDLVARLG